MLTCIRDPETEEHCTYWSVRVILQPEHRLLVCVCTAIRHRVPAHKRAAGRYHAPEAGRRYLHDITADKGDEFLRDMVADVGISNAKRAAEAVEPKTK